MHRLRAFSGKLEVISAGKRLSPSYGELAVTVQGEGRAEAAQFSSPIGRDGEFYLENIPAGKWPGVIEYRGGQCNFSMAIPAATERVVKLATVACVRP